MPDDTTIVSNEHALLKAGEILDAIQTVIDLMPESNPAKALESLTEVLRSCLGKIKAEPAARSDRDDDAPLFANFDDVAFDLPPMVPGEDSRIVLRVGGVPTVTVAIKHNLSGPLVFGASVGRGDFNFREVKDPAGLRDLARAALCAAVTLENVVRVEAAE